MNSSSAWTNKPLRVSFISRASNSACLNNVSCKEIAVLIFPILDYHPLYRQYNRIGSKIVPHKRFLSPGIPGLAALFPAVAIDGQPDLLRTKPPYHYASINNV